MSLGEGLFMGGILLKKMTPSSAPAALMDSNSSAREEITSYLVQNIYWEEREIISEFSSVEIEHIQMSIPVNIFFKECQVCHLFPTLTSLKLAVVKSCVYPEKCVEPEPLGKLKCLLRMCSRQWRDGLVVRACLFLQRTPVQITEPSPDNSQPPATPISGDLISSDILGHLLSCDAL